MAEAAKTKETITLEEARRVIDAAERKAEDIAVADAGENLRKKTVDIRREGNTPVILSPFAPISG